MPPARSVPPQLLGRAFTRGEARSLGVTDRQLDGPSYERIGPGVHQVHGHPATGPDLLRATATARPGRVVAGSQALKQWKIPLPWRVERQLSRLLTFAVPSTGSAIHHESHRSHSRPADVRISTMRIADLDEHTVHVPIAVPESSRDGAVPSVLPVLTPARAVLSALGDLWFEDAVGALDALLRVGRPGFDERLEPYATRRSLEDFTDQLARAHGIVRFREALEWARVGADSIMESLCRMHFTRAEIDEPEINVPVPLGNGQVMRPPDGWWPQYRTVFEYQGAGHQSLQQMRRDDRIHSEFESHGIRVVRLFNEDLVRSPMRPPPPMRETTRRPDTWHSLPPGDVLSAQNPAVLRVSAALKLGGWKGSSSRPLR